MKLVRNLTITLILIFSFSNLAFAATNGIEPNKQIDGVKTSLMFTNEKLKSGNNDFIISLTDKNGQPLSGIDFKVTVDMDRAGMGNDGMGKEKPMEISLKEGAKKGEYAGSVNLKNSGKWIIKATFNLNGQEKNTDFNFKVESDGPNLFVVGGFIGIVIVIIFIAVINKKKTKKN